MRESRSEYVFKNVTISLIMQVVKNILAFLGRTVFVHILGAEYLGVNTLFTDVLTVLSFAELGVGNAMVFSLYKPLAEQNKEKIKSLMKLYAKAYRVIGIVIATLGLCVVPVIPYIIKDVSYVQENITLLYLLFLLNSVLSYFFVYKKSLIIADQKNYIVEVYQEVFYAIQVIAQIVFLLITRQFIPYLLIVIATTLANNIFMANKADKLYPYLTDKNVKPLEKSEVSSIVTNVKALVVYKVGGIILESVDSIFISALINTITVGLYANYKLVIRVFRTIGNQAMNGIIASIGNLNVNGDENKKERVFYEMFYINAWYYGFAAAGLCCFLTPVVRIWLGDSYVMAFDAVLAAVVYFYVSNMHYPCFTYRTTTGLFVYGKFVPMISAIINIMLDLAMGIKWGLPGILWASVIARLLTYELIDPILIYQKILHRPVGRYFVYYVGAMVLIVIDGLISAFISSKIVLSGIVGTGLRIAVFSLVFNAVFLLVTFRTKQFQSILQRVKQIILRKE